MKILFLTENFPPEVNAIASRVHERAVYWVRDGHSVTVISSFPNFPQGKLYPGYRQKLWQVEYKDGIRVVRVPTFIARNQGVALRTLDFLSFMLSSAIVSIFVARPDVVVATSPQFFCAVGGWFASLVKRRPFVLEIADLWPASITAVGALRPGRLIRLMERLELFLYRRSAAVVALTRAFKRNLVRRGVGSEKVYVIRNGVDLQRFGPRAKDVTLAKQLGLDSKFVVGYLGTHGMAHDLESVLAAARRLANVPEVFFLFVGAGAAKSALLARTAADEISNVVFVDPQPKEAMPSYWSLCDVALVHLKNEPTFAEVIPSKIFEAMGMGIPILLVSPAGEASEIVEQEQCGAWVPAGNSIALAERIRALVSGRDALDGFRKRCLQSAPNHTRQVQASSFIEVLRVVTQS